MKNAITILFTVLSISAISQTLKTYSGGFSNGYSYPGKATYTYYLNENGAEIKHGKFVYTMSTTGFTQNFQGEFKNGRKEGTWIYKNNMTDHELPNGKYATGIITLESNYKNGVAHGTWKQVRSYKLRERTYLGTWLAFENLRTMSISMSFNQDKLVGKLSISDEFGDYYVEGQFDDNSICTGTWTYHDVGFGRNQNMIFVNGAVGNNIALLKEYSSLNTTELKERGITIDTICGLDKCVATWDGTTYSYFKKMLSNDYFLYMFIGGDDYYENMFKGGCNIEVNTINYASLSENSNYKQAEDFYGKNELLKAYEFYTKIDLKTVKPSERQKVSDKIAFIKPKIGELIEMYHSNSAFLKDYINLQYDSLEIDKAYFDSKIALRTIKDENGWTLVTDENGLQHRLYDNPDMIKYNFEKPWENRNWFFAKECFSKNSGVYSPILIAITEQYFNYTSLLEKEEANIRNSGYSFSYENINNSFFTYNKNTLLKNLTEGKRKYNQAKSIIDLQEKSNDKKTKIETLNNQNKKKTLFSKYQIVYYDFNVALRSFTEPQSLASILTQLNVFLDKVISLYNQDTKELEKQLKDVETADQIKSIILGK